VRLLAALVVAAALAGVASASDHASRVVDRTVLCKTSGEGFPDPLRFLAVHATPRLGDRSPDAGVYNGPSGVAQGVHATVRTGPPFAPNPGTGAAVLSRVSCGQTSLKIPLSSKGLRGGATILGDRWKCEVPATIVIRLRAVFRNPVTFSPSKDARYLNHAEGRIRTGAIMVTTKNKAPIALVSVDDATGKASIWVSPTRCRAAD
jgi:hypothetical protein